MVIEMLDELKYDEIKNWIEEFGEKIVYEKVYFYVEDWDATKDIMDIIIEQEFLTSE